MVEAVFFLLSRVVGKRGALIVSCLNLGKLRGTRESFEVFSRKDELRGGLGHGLAWAQRRGLFRFL